jgi:hypothetical protein
MCGKGAGGRRGPATVTQVIERVNAHYEVQAVEMGTIYRWCPESVLIECECGKKPTLTVSKDACGECSADHRAIVEEVLEARPKEEQEVDHPWRSLRPYYTPTRGV